MEIIERIDHWGRMTPDRDAHNSGGRTLTYGELCRRSDALAARLAGSLPEKAPVVVLGHKEPELLIAYLGAIKSGRAYVPVDTAVPRQRVDRIVAASGAPLTLTPEKVAALSEGGEPAPPCRLESEDHYYIMFTSGSTGEPKGVPITYGCLQSFLRWTLGEHAFEEGREVFLNVVPYSFDVSLMDTYPALVTGGTVTSVTKDEIANPRRLYPLLGGSGVTTWVSTPSFAQMCLVEPAFNAGMLPQLRRFLFCGETLAPEIASQLLDRFPAAEVWNTYGPTEATVATTSIRITREILDQYSSLPIGYPMPGTRVLVMDEQGHEAPPGERGQIIIAGPNVSPGYLNRPDLVEKAFFVLDGHRAYRTGDWGRCATGCCSSRAGWTTRSSCTATGSSWRTSRRTCGPCRGSAMPWSCRCSSRGLSIPSPPS